jgi:hypothetical protein
VWAALFEFLVKEKRKETQDGSGQPPTGTSYQNFMLRYKGKRVYYYHVKEKRKL